MRDVDLAFDPSKRVGLWEPAVIRDGDVFKMWFIYTAGARPTNCLWYATSSDGRAWDLHPQPLLTGGLLGKYRLHYPQVVRTDEGYELYFTLRNQVAVRTALAGHTRTS